MHSAPAVEYPVGRSAFQAGLDAALVFAWLVMQASWWWSLRGAALPAAWWLSAVSGVLVLVGLHWRGRTVAQGRLCWEPAVRHVAGTLPQAGALPGRWLWHSQAYRHGTELADLRWSLDLQGHVLLHLRNAAGVGWWVWLAHDSAPADWQALREALVAWRETQRQTDSRGH